MKRRRLLSTVPPAALALSGVAAAAPAAINPDAGLLALCAEYETLERKIVAANAGAILDTEDSIYEAMTGPRERQDAIVEAILAAPPRTPAGFAAVVKLLVIWHPRLLEHDRELDTTELLHLALYRGIMGRAGA